MKKTTIATLAICLMGIANYTMAQVPVKPDHVIFVLEENYAYSEIIGSSYAPVLTALSKDTTTENFTKAYAITHPSEPNYLDLFSGSNHGVLLDETGPDGSAPFNDCNLASSLIAKGYTFIGYSESQPSLGWDATDAPPYYTKHCPWINWMGGTVDTVPIYDDLPMAGYYPDSLHYANLPTVSWVIPNIDDDMHDPSTASIAIPNGDSWFKTNMMPLVRWCQKPANNSLVIVIWDEDDYSSGNNIPLLFCGAMVAGGNCTTNVNHYSILRTVEDMYGCSPLCGSSSTASDVPASVWKVTGIKSIDGPVSNVTAWPVPVKETLNLSITSKDEVKTNVIVSDVMGRQVKELSGTELKTGVNDLTINTNDLVDGVYFVNISGENVNITKKIVVGK